MTTHNLKTWDRLRALQVELLGVCEKMLSSLYLIPGAAEDNTPERVASVRNVELEKMTTEALILLRAVPAARRVEALRAIIAREHSTATALRILVSSWGAAHSSIQALVLKEFELVSESRDLVRATPRRDRVRRRRDEPD